MCGRYAIASDPEWLAAELGAVDHVGGQLMLPNSNITPASSVPILVERYVDGKVVRELRPVKWGLVPGWAKDGANAAKMINARSETVAEKPSYRDSFAQRRCIVPATGWYEWQRAEGLPGFGGAKSKLAKTKDRTPYFTRGKEESALGLAGIWSVWRDANTPNAAPLVTMAILTTQATGALAEIHERRPVVLPRGAFDAWLDPTSLDARDLLAGIGDAPLADLHTYPVGPLANKIANNSPALLAAADELVDAEPEGLF
jgi:putative SOS response-associated peptidase YedK